MHAHTQLLGAVKSNPSPSEEEDRLREEEGEETPDEKRVGALPGPHNTTSILAYIYEDSA